MWTPGGEIETKRWGSLKRTEHGHHGIERDGKNKIRNYVISLGAQTMLKIEYSAPLSFIFVFISYLEICFARTGYVRITRLPRFEFLFARPSTDAHRCWFSAVFAKCFAYRPNRPSKVNTNLPIQTKHTMAKKKTISNPEIQTEKLQSILSTMAKIECLSFASLYVCHPHAACEFTFGTRLCETRTWSILRINTTIEKNTNQQHLSKFHAISSTFTENAISLFQTRSKQCKFYLNRFMSLQFQLKLDISSRFLVCRVNALGWHSQIWWPYAFARKFAGISIWK